MSTRLLRSVAATLCALLLCATISIGLCAAQSGYPEVLIHFPAGSMTLTTETDSQLNAFQSGVSLSPGHVFFLQAYSDSARHDIDKKERSRGMAMQACTTLRTQNGADSVRYAEAIDAYVSARETWNQQAQEIIDAWARSRDQLKADG